MNVAGGPIGIIMETRHSLSGFPGCSTNGCLFMPLCQGPAQPPPCARNIIFHLKLENLVPAAMFKYFCGLTAHHMHSIFLKIVLSVMTVICGGHVSGNQAASWGVLYSLYGVFEKAGAIVQFQLFPLCGNGRTRLL